MKLDSTTSKQEHVVLESWKIWLTKVSVPPLVASSPFWLGWMFQSIGLKALGLFLGLIVPQYLIFPLFSYYGGSEGLPIGVLTAKIITLLTWIIIAAIYLVICRRQPGGKSIVVFMILWICTMVACHIVMKCLNYRFVLDGL